MTTPLRRGDNVRLLDELGRPQEKIAAVGQAGFTVDGHSKTWWWSDRGKTWSNDVLDKMDRMREGSGK